MNTPGRVLKIYTLQVYVLRSIKLHGGYCTNMYYELLVKFGVGFISV